MYECIYTPYIKTNDQITNIFTKFLAKKKFPTFCKCGILPINQKYVQGFLASNRLCITQAYIELKSNM